MPRRVTRCRGEARTRRHLEARERQLLPVAPGDPQRVTETVQQREQRAGRERQHDRVAAQPQAAGADQLDIAEAERIVFIKMACDGADQVEQSEPKDRARGGGERRYI